MPDLVCLGEILIDFCATVGDVTVAEAPGFTRAAGGAPANVAVAARRLGASAGFIGAVGDDPFGEYLRGVLAAEGVDTSCLVRRSDVHTPLAFVAVRSDGAGDFFFHHGGSLTPIEPRHVDAGYVASARALHFGSISRIDEPARQATDQARRIAADNGLIVSYDPNYRPRLWDSPDVARQVIRDGFRGATVAKVSRQEWEFILGTEDFRAGAGQLLDEGVGLVIRSEGERGASFATPTTGGHVDAFPVKSVEFTGAGDAFVGAVLADLLADGVAAAGVGRLDAGALTRIITRANAAGALTTTRFGAIPALPRGAELEAFLSRATAASARPGAGGSPRRRAAATRPGPRPRKPTGRKRAP